MAPTPLSFKTRGGGGGAGGCRIQGPSPAAPPPPPPGTPTAPARSVEVGGSHTLSAEHSRFSKLLMSLCDEPRSVGCKKICHSSVGMPCKLGQRLGQLQTRQSDDGTQGCRILKQARSPDWCIRYPPKNHPCHVPCFRTSWTTLSIRCALGYTAETFEKHTKLLRALTATAVSH